MPELLLQFLGLCLLLGGIIVGYLLWIRRRRGAINRQGAGLLFLLIVTMMGGLLGSPFWWADARQSFAWDVPPLASRMLASAGWSFAVLCFLTLRRPSTRRVRLALLELGVYLAPLAIAILLFHRQRFDLAAPITYAFFGIVAALLVSDLWYLLRQPRIQPDEPRDGAPAQRMVQAWLLAVAVVAGLWGLALFATDAGPSKLIWVWPGDLLSSRLIGVMLLTIAVGALYSFRFADTAGVMLAMLVIYGAGLAVASLWNGFLGKPVPMSYLLAFGIIAAVSLLLAVFNAASLRRPGRLSAS